ncbi:uncharacterized protein LOC117808944 [Xyrichtys novacula]|uniref:E3 ubiquitin-protein ligase Topors n=1 Tax=Xyrichtys novacula TaxID=13765 RepID=A0AAV1EI51_XYRNO|nr:uncharacterized protein LOC117808944 [Xyrichtys novacula]
MPLVRRRKKNPDEDLQDSAQMMAPTRMKLRVRQRDSAAAEAGVGGGGQQEAEEQRSRERGGRSSSRRKNSSSTAVAASSSSSPSSSSASASARAVMAAEETSPDSKCPICLDRFNNLAYLDRCLHRFCFLCIQEWSHNKAECPLCKQPFTSILHSVRAEDDFKEYTLRPAPANSSVAATVAMVAAIASAARTNHQMRLMLRRRREGEGEAATTRRRRRDRGGRAGRRAQVRPWYLDSPPLPLPAISMLAAEDSEEGEELEDQRRNGADLSERGVIFEGLTGLGGAVTPLAPTDRASRRLMTRLAARQRLQREGGTVRRLRERETVAFRRALYRCGVRVNNNGNQGQQQRDVTAESFRRNPTHLNRLRPWLRRELTVLYGAHGSLVDIVQRIIMARLARHGLEDTPTIEEELRPFLLARTDHFLHELVSFARSPLSLEEFDLQAVYEPPDTAMELDGMSSSSNSSSVIAISEGEEEERTGEGSAHDDVIQTGSCLSLSAWDEETPGPSYSTAEPSCSVSSLSFSPAPQETANEEGGEKRREEEGEECLIVGYKKPIAERTPELVQLSSDTEEEEEEERKEERGEERREERTEERAEAEKPLDLPSSPSPLSYSPTVPPSTSGTRREEPEGQKEVGRSRSWSGSSGRSRKSVSALREGEWRRNKEKRDRKFGESEVTKERRMKRKRSRRGRERRKSGTLYNPVHSIYPAAMMRQCSHSSSPFYSSADSASPLPPSPPDSTWSEPCSQMSPLTSSVSSQSSPSSSPLFSSPQLSSQTPPTPSLSPSYRGNSHHTEKPGGKRKYKSRHLDSDEKDPTWRPSSGHRKERRMERGEKERRRRRREKQRRDAHRARRRDSSSRRCRGDRSPSVEIIYEGTISSISTQPSTRERQRKRHRKTQLNSSPVIITLDSDSSHDNNNDDDDINLNDNSDSGCSSPLSSQQTVDFCSLPPLPLMPSAGVGGALNADIGELPVDILDQESDSLELEPAERSGAGATIAIDNSDNSDGDVDVEKVEGSVLGSDEDKGPKMDKEAETREARPVKEDSTSTGKTCDQVQMRDSKDMPSDRRLLATILNDLRGISASSSESNNLSDTRRAHLWEHPNKGNQLVLRTQHNLDFSEGLPSSNIRNQNQRTDLPARSSSLPSLPPVEQQEVWVQQQSQDVPPLLKKASPIQSHNRNTPPPLKHKDAVSPHLLPIPTSNLLSAHVGISKACPGELPQDNKAIPSISTLKRQFTGSLPLQGYSGSASSSSTINIHSVCKTDDFRSAAPSEFGALAINIHSTTDKPASDSCSSGADFSFHPLNSRHYPTKEQPLGHRAPPTDLHPGWSKDEPAPTDSTSGHCRNRIPGPDSCQVAIIDLHPSSKDSVERTLPGSDGFSGPNDASLPVCVSTTGSRTRTPSLPIESPCMSENLCERVPPAGVSSVLTAGSGGRLTPRTEPRTKCSVDFFSFSAASKELTDKAPSGHGERTAHGRPVDLHLPTPVPPVDKHDIVSTFIDKHFNRTPLTSTDFQMQESKNCSVSRPDIYYPPHSGSTSNHMEKTQNLPFNIQTSSTQKTSNDFHPKVQTTVDFHSDSPLRDLQLPTDRHASQQSAENHLSSSSPVDARSDSQSSVDEQSARSLWKTHAGLK